MLKKFGKISVAVLLIAIFFMPQTSFANASTPDLDEAFNQFRMTYEKDKSFARLAEEEQQAVNERNIIMKLKKDATFDADDFGVRFTDKITAQMYVVQVFSEDDYWKKLIELQNDANVIYAEPDYVIEPTFVPEDPLFTEQWYLEKINMQQAWGVTRGSEDVTIAVVDSGVNENHPDLKGKVLEGYNFVAQNKNTSDDNGHGTHIAGIIAANANQKGIAGIDHSAKILPLKVFCKEGSGSISKAIKGIFYAIDYGVDVINMSYVTKEKSKAEEEAIWQAHKEGIVLVAAAGNEGKSKDLYPASYSPVISVSATNEEDQRASFSNYGNWIDIAAPGKDIYSTNYHGGYGTLSGTSFSTPIVSALAALLKAKHPQWTPNEIEWALEHGADAVVEGNSEWNYIFGFGRVNAYSALTAKRPSYVNSAGNVYSKAEMLSIGQTIDEKMEIPLDVDWYKFHVTKDSEVEINLSNVSDHIDLVGVLYEGDMDKPNELAVIDNGGMGESETHTIDLERGMYYLVIHDYYGRWSNHPYELKVSQHVNMFPDVKQYQKEIAFLANRGIIHGFPDGTFGPTKNVKRLQAVRIILREMGIDPKKFTAPDPGFYDMKAENDGYQEIASAVELKFIKGKQDNTFDADGFLTRGQMASILAQAYELEGTNNSGFNDIDTDHWAYDSINKLAANGITTGYSDGTFRSYEKISRQHFALFMYRILERQ